MLNEACVGRAVYVDCMSHPILRDSLDVCVYVCSTFQETYRYL